MKKVWIASILATLMLTIPLTSVVGANEVDDCNCNPVSDLQVVRIERLLERLESRINFIMLKLGHIPEVKEKCKEVLDVINSDSLREKFCDFIELLTYTIANFIQNMPRLLSNVLYYLFYLPMFSLVMLWFLICKPIRWDNQSIDNRLENR